MFAVDSLDRTTAACWPTLLSIDDDPQIGDAIRIRLRDYELTVRCASYGMHGIWLATAERPELIITDLCMPQGAGEYIIDCLRSNGKTRAIPVIVLTGQSPENARRRLAKLDVQAVLTKPAPFDRLRSVIEQFIPLRPRELPPAERVHDFQVIQE